MRYNILVLALLLLPTGLFAGPGGLDLTFDNDPSSLGAGALTLDLGNRGGWVQAEDVAVTSDGKILIVGVAGAGGDSVGLVRLLPDGQPDTTFGTNGRVIVSAGGPLWRLARALPNNRPVVVVGYTSDPDLSFLRRFNPNGSLDNSFGSSGIVSISNFTAADIAIDTNDRIVIAGTSGDDIVLRRFEAGGGTDGSFGTAGIASTDFGYYVTIATAVAIQSDGKILVAGRENSNSWFALARYTAAGVLDTGFNGSGKVTTAVGSASGAYAVAIQPDGKIVAGGFSGPPDITQKFALVRYNPDGTPDGAFGTAGSVTTTPPHQCGGNAITAVAIQVDGKIVVAGYACRSVVTRYLQGGTLDPVFPVVETNSGLHRAVALQPDGKIVAVGTASEWLNATNSWNHYFGIVRYLGDTADLSVTVTPSANQVAVDGEMSFTLHYANGGPEPASQVVVTDTLPAGFNFVNANIEGCSGTTTVTCNLGSLASGANDEIVLNVTPTAAGSFENRAEIHGEGFVDTPANNTAAATVTVVAASTAEPPPAPAGEGETPAAAGGTTETVTEETPPASTTAPADETAASGEGTTGEIVPPSVGGTTTEQPASSAKAGGCSLTPVQHF